MIFGRNLCVLSKSIERNITFEYYNDSLSKSGVYVINGTNKIAIDDAAISL